MRMGAHTETLSFRGTWHGESLHTRLDIVTEVESLSNWRRRMLKIWWASPKDELKRKLKLHAPKLLWVKSRRKVGAATKKYPKGNPRIPKEYWDLRDVFSERGSDMLTPHRPTDCSIEIILGAKLPKLKLYSMTP